MKKCNYFIIVLLTIVIIESCIDLADPLVKIVDGFDLRSRDGQKWSFQCKLGCASHPKIGDAQNVKWNDRTIIVKNRNSNSESEWYIFHSSLEKIKCCHGNTILKADSLTMLSFIAENKIVFQKKKVLK